MSESPRTDAHPADVRVGTILAERYRIDALVGEGGMGRVYAAEHVLMRKRLAVKVLHRELTTMPEVVARFEREATAAANIDHPNVAAATDFGKLPEGAVFLVLEFVQGKSLREEIAGGPLPPERALHITRQIAAGLSSAHALDIVHRDLKPENVMLVEKGGDPDFVKVLDFGIAKVPISEMPALVASSTAHTPISKIGMVFGTPEYMAPEQALGQTVDGRADLYALGVILYEMLCGSRPFSSLSQVGILGQQLSKTPPPLHERTPGIKVPPAVAELAMKLLEREVTDRYQSAAQVVEAASSLLAPATGGGIYRFTMADGSAGLRTTRAAPEAAASAGAGASREGAPPAGGGEALAAARGLEVWRGRLPPALRRVTARVPARSLFALALGLPLLLLAAFFFGTVRPGGEVRMAKGERMSAELARPLAPAPAPPSVVEAPSAPEPPRASPSTNELEAARAAGPSALAALFERYPRDVRLALELGRARLLAKDFQGAVRQVKAALALDAGARGDRELTSILFQTAQVSASSAETFSLLDDGTLGPSGPDIAYDLVTTPSVRPWVRARAETYLRSPAFERSSSPGLRAIVKLRYAKGCHEKRAALADLRPSADERALFELVPLQQRTGCGRRKRDDCNACLRTSSELDIAIAVVRGRPR